MKKAIVFILVNAALAMTGFAQTQLELNVQAYKDYTLADAKMNALYKKVLKSFNQQADKKLLLEGQRAWIKYKETHCKLAAAAYEGGSIQPLIKATCLTAITQDRIKELQALIENN